MISYKIFDSFEKLENMREEWDNFVLESGSTVYMTFDWCKTWWEFYGSKKELSVFIFYDDTKIIGILPVYFEKIFSVLFSLKVCRLVGANIPPKVFNPPISSAYKPLVLELLLKITLSKCDLVSVGPVSENYFRPIELKTDSVVRKFYKIEYDEYTFFDLPDSFEQYLDLLDKSEKKDFNYILRRLNRDYKIEMAVNKSFDEADFNNFLNMHSAQWLEQGKLGHFKSWPSGYEFNLSLAKRQSDLGRFRLIKVMLNDSPVVFNYGYVLGNKFYWQLPARSVSAGLNKFSLGKTGTVIMMKQMIDEKIKTVEGGIGQYDYKLNIGARSEKTFLYRFVAYRKSSLLKFKILSVEKKSGELVYHKIWYRRIQPLLPVLLKQPIPKRWIKLDY